MVQFVVGIDLGGTNIAGTLMDAAGEVRGWLSWPTEAQEGPEKVIQRIIAMVDALLTENGLARQDLRGIGLGVPGLVNSREGKSVFSPNLPGWRDIPVAEKVSKGAGVPVIIDNDVRMAAWGEKFLGAAREKEDVICITLGTGIGSGIFIRGKMFKGRNESAGEIGHITVEKNGLQCNCGNYGCLEMYASGRGIARRAKEALAAKQTSLSLMLELTEGDIDRITAATVAVAAVQGDELALEIIEETAQYLGIGLAAATNLLNPERIVLGGGVMRAGDLLLKPVRRVVRERAMPLNREVEIVTAELGELGGAIGAAALAKMEFIERKERPEWT